MCEGAVKAGCVYVGLGAGWALQPPAPQTGLGVPVTVQQTCYRAACALLQGDCRTDVPRISQNVVTARLYRIKQHFINISGAKIVIRGC